MRLWRVRDKGWGEGGEGKYGDTGDDDDDDYDPRRNSTNEHPDRIMIYAVPKNVLQESDAVYSHVIVF